MIKKFKNWYCNLLPFEKIRLLGWGLGIVFYLFIFFLLFPLVSSFAEFCIIIFFFCPFSAFCGYGIIYLHFRPNIAEAEYKCDVRKQEQEAELKSWFSSSSCPRVTLKSEKASFDILLFYYKKHLLVTAFYLEQNVIEDRTFYSISADCQGLKERVVFSDTIENPGYILARFTLKR